MKNQLKYTKANKTFLKCLILSNNEKMESKESFCCGSSLNPQQGKDSINKWMNGEGPREGKEGRGGKEGNHDPAAIYCHKIGPDLAQNLNYFRFTDMLQHPATSWPCRSCANRSENGYYI